MEALNRLKLLERSIGKDFPERDTVVGIVGLGAVGSWVLRMLLSCGYRNYVLMDDDVLKETDFNRNALFRWDAIGRPKVELAKEFVAEFLRPIGGARVMCVADTVGREGNWREHLRVDFLFDCIDGLNGKANLIRFLLEEGVRFVSSGSAARKVSTSARLGRLTEAKDDRLLDRLSSRLRGWGAEVDRVWVVYLDGKMLPEIGGSEKEQRLKRRRSLGSWILSPMAIAIRMIEAFLLGQV